MHSSPRSEPAPNARGTDAQAARQNFAQQQTWQHRAQELQECVQRLQFPSISVVVLTYNNWAYTQACLESLFLRTDYPGALEIVVADNASVTERGTTQEWASREPRMKLVLNATNLGFSAGNNTGLVAATGDYLVLLNNDTVVTRGWLLTLLRHFQADAKLGLLGPATNHIGNESKVPVFYETMEHASGRTRYTLPRMGWLSHENPGVLLRDDAPGSVRKGGPDGRKLWARILRG